MKIEPVKLKEIIYDNWKDYFIKKFSENNIFDIQEFDVENEYVESYNITLKDKSSKTEIIFQIFKKDIPYLELHDIRFNNPNSPKLTENNTKDPNGFDGVGSEFNLKNVIDVEDWLNIPLNYGWKEKTTYYNGKELKTEAIWKQNGKISEIPIKQNYLEKYGCLSFPIVPFAIFWNSQKIKLFPKKIEIKIIEIEPMINN
ncbi:hypothetical protein [Flavobacterium sp. WC2509]|uniref:hypothetical protein n=1 Tax=Flavobacterium sp. WC2509 TaxID=3461406 RepID=UPI0040443994